MHRLQLKLIVKTSINVLIWNVHCRDWHICASAGIHPQGIGNIHHCVQLHNMLKGIIQNCSLKNTKTTEADVKTSHSHVGLINLECEMGNAFINA